MRKFGKTKIQNETVKQSTSEPVKEIRHILKQSIPIEDVILFSDAEHTEGTSRYWFNFPSTWRTITNQNLILGVRSISLVNEIPQVIKFDVRFVIAHNINQTGDNQKIIHLNASFDIDLKFNQGYSLLKRITDNLYVSYILTANKEEDPSVVFQAYPINEFSPNCFGIRVYAENVPDDKYVRILYLEQGNYFDQLYSEWNYEEYDSAIQASEENRFVRFIVPYANTLYVKDFYLTSSIATQSEHNYLGRTNDVYQPPKQFPLSSADNRFWIELHSFYIKDATLHAEIPEKYKNQFLIELQLITQEKDKYI